MKIEIYNLKGLDSTIEEEYFDKESLLAYLKEININSLTEFYGKIKVDDVVVFDSKHSQFRSFLENNEALSPMLNINIEDSLDEESTDPPTWYAICYHSKEEFEFMFVTEEYQLMALNYLENIRNKVSLGKLIKDETS